MNENVETWFEMLTPSQRSLLEELRRLILVAEPQIVEELKWNQPCYTRNGLFCYLQKAANHVSIGFQRGALLRDHNRLLQGKGKDMRHINIKYEDKIDKSAIGHLITEALALDES